MGDAARYVIVPSKDRPKWLGPLVESMSAQCDTVVVVDNASDPPVDGAELDALSLGAAVHVIRDEEQPPNLARLWNVMFDHCAELAAGPVWDVAVLNDDVLIPHGWLDIVCDGLREHPTAVVAHTGTGRRIQTPELRTVLDNELTTRMCPHAFVVRGELGLRADESMRWWYFDTDFDWRARQSGGVLCVPGPLVSNALSNISTVGVQREQANRDWETFEAKWANR